MRGTVTDIGGGPVLGTVTLSIDAVPFGSVNTDAAGAYIFPNVPAGLARVECTTLGQTLTNSGVHAPPTDTILDMQAQPI